MICKREQTNKINYIEQLTGPDGMVPVLEVDQFQSTGNIDWFNWDSYHPDKVTGGDVAAARAIMGGLHCIRKMVDGNHKPMIGYCWYVENPKTKKFEFWKATFDTSD